MGDNTLATLFGCKFGNRKVSTQTMFNYTDKRTTTDGRIVMGSEYHIKSVSKQPNFSDQNFEVTKILESKKLLRQKTNKWIKKMHSHHEDTLITRSLPKGNENGFQSSPNLLNKSSSSRNKLASIKPFQPMSTNISAILKKEKKRMEQIKNKNVISYSQYMKIKTNLSI